MGGASGRGRVERWDAVVVGLGVMGLAALDALAGRGLRVLGLERFDVPHALGSSHGGTRVIRKAYYEDPGYVPLLHRSWDAWRALEAEVGETLLLQTGGLHFGPADSLDLRGVLAAAEQHGLAHEVLDVAGIARRFGQFQPAPGDVGVFEEDAGILFAERSCAALAERAMRRGAVIEARAEVARLDPEGERLAVVMADGTRHEAARVVLALGPWWPGTGLLPAPVPLEVERQVQCWVRPRDPEAFRPGRFPVFLRFSGGGGRGAESGADEGGGEGREGERGAASDKSAGESGAELVYGLPEAYLPGLKVAQHHGGRRVPAEAVDAIDRAVSEADLAGVRRFLARHLPGADGPLLGARVCMYTNTPDAHFALGLHPDEPRAVVATGFSGHGFKLAPAVGDILADYAASGMSALTLPLFDLRRFAR